MKESLEEDAKEESISEAEANRACLDLRLRVSPDAEFSEGSSVEIWREEFEEEGGRMPGVMGSTVK